MAQISIGEAIVHGNRIENHIQVNDPALQPYFTGNTFYAEYPTDISGVPRGLLNIPALSTIIHFAVAVGATIEAGQVDATYLRSCSEAQDYLHTCKGFEMLRCTAKIQAQPVQTPPYPTEKEGLLFSGGSDSTSSWIKRRRINPKLYLIWGLDVPLNWDMFWDQAKSRYTWMNPSVIKTNTEDLYYPGMLGILGKGLTESYRPTYSFSINALGVCAPLTYLDHVGLLQLSSTYPSRHYLNPKYPWAMYRPSFLVNQYWRWGSTRCLEVDHEYSTTEKIIKYVKPYYDSGNPLFLRVCGNRQRLQETGFKAANCLLCDKCQRTLGMLLVAGIDPRKAGFPVTGEHYARMRSDIEAGTWNRIYLRYHWMEVQQHIPPVVTEDYGGSKAFLEWLRGYRW